MTFVRLHSFTVAAVVSWFIFSGCGMFVEDFPAPAAEASDAGITDALDVQDASQGEDSSATEDTAPAVDSTAEPECDKDGDGHDAAGACGGDDCDDDDPNVFPGQEKYFTTPTKHGGFDYDCDQKWTWPPDKNKKVDCDGLGPVGCDTNSVGFFGKLPDCGASGSWGGCKVELTSCNEAPQMQVVLPCK